MNIKSLFVLLLLLIPFSTLADEPGDTESPFYGQLLLHDYHGEGTFYAQEAYAQYDVKDGVAVWVTGYRDQEFWSASAGLAKTWENGWTVALGVGKARFDGENHTVIAPWVGYGGELWEFTLSAEHYSHGGGTYYQGYLQRRFGERNYFGLYGETGFGIGPSFTRAFNDHVAFRVAVPVAERGDTSVLASLIFTF